MRIISKFHDYYDSAMSFGIDKSIIYNRVCDYMIPTNKNSDLIRGEDLKRIPIDPLINFDLNYNGHKEFLNRNFFSRYNDSNLFNVCLLICGKAYFGIVHSQFISFGSNRKYENNVNKKPLFVNDKNSFDKLLEIWKPKSSDYYNREDLKDLNRSFEMLLLLNENADKIENDVMKLHFETKSPIIAISLDGGIGFNINPELRLLGFSSVLDSHTINQEISMFISGVLGDIEKETINISDKDKIVGKGFDYKTSFRKEKS